MNNQRIATDIRKTMKELKKYTIFKFNWTEQEFNTIMDYIDKMNDNRLVNIFIAERLAVHSRISVNVSGSMNELVVQYMMVRIGYEIENNNNKNERQN